MDAIYFLDITIDIILIVVLIVSIIFLINAIQVVKSIKKGIRKVEAISSFECWWHVIKKIIQLKNKN